MFLLIRNNMFTKGYTPWNKGKKVSSKRAIHLRSQVLKVGKKTRFKKGLTPWNKGKKTGFNFKQSETMKKLYSKKKIAVWNKGKPWSEEIKKKLSEAHKGQKHTEEWKKRMSGKNSPAWQGGISFQPYSTDWTKTLKLAIRQRDKFTCQKCGITEEESIKKYGKVLSVNHIDYNKKNCDPKNLNTLCCACNASVNFNREYWTKHFQEKTQLLYTA